MASSRAWKWRCSGLVRIVAVASLLPAFFVTWYLSGSDGTATNPVAPLLGIGVMITAVWSAVTAFRTLDADPAGALLIFAGPPALMLLARPFSGNDAVEREPFGTYVFQVLFLCGPLLLGVVYGRF
jgi:hypothetical protein